MALDLSSLDFQQARIKQVLFKSRLRSVLYGVRDADDALLSRADNPLGQWLDAVVKPRYGARPEVAQLEAALQHQLDTGRDLLRLRQRGLLEEARAGLEHIDADATRIEALLLNLEQAVV